MKTVRDTAKIPINPYTGNRGGGKMTPKPVFAQNFVKKGMKQLSFVTL